MSSNRTTINPEDLSYCGVDCKACDVFKATVYGDEKARMRAVKLWTKTAQQHWGMQTLDPAILDCAGCRINEVKHKGYGHCPIIPCVTERKLSSCGLCPQWRECERLGEVLKDEPRAGKNLEMIEKGSNKPDAGEG